MGTLDNDSIEKLKQILFPNGADSDITISKDEADKHSLKLGYFNREYWWKYNDDEINHPSHYNDDEIDHPSHYTHGSIESIDLMIECEGKQAAADFCICNCWKYLYRHRHKNNDISDIRKMIWYANKYIELVNQINAENANRYEGC